MTCLLQEEVMSSCGGEQLARRRLQQKGDLFDQGGMWKLRWHEDKITSGGELTRGWSRAVHLDLELPNGGRLEGGLELFSACCWTGCPTRRRGIGTSAR